MTCTAVRHGTDDAYANATCRCPDARRQHLVARKRRELRLITTGPVRIDATGSARRLRALAAIGYGLHDLAPRLSVDSGYLGHLRRPTHPQVLRSTASAIASLYDELAETPGPSPKATRHAEQQGWLPPKWWDDDTIDDPHHTPDVVDRARHWTDVDPIAVARAATGEPMELTRAERWSAVALLNAHGIAHVAIARTLHMHPRQVLKDLARLALSPPATAGPSAQKRTTA